MSDETAVPTEQAADPGTAGSDPVVGFCQQCGRTLSASTQRRVASGVFCPSCVAAGVAPAAAWSPVNAGPSGGYGAGPTDARYPGANPNQARRSRSATPGEPNPVLAGFFGFVPGVGAMYNGQYPKGAIHLIVFVVLVSLADNLNWVFWWFVWGWIFYQAFDAYHTALARRDGQPLPDPFGWNELGERMGFGRNWPPPTNAPAAGAAAPFRPAPPPYATPVDAGAAFGSAAPSLAPFPADPRAYAAPADVAPPEPAATYASAGEPYQASYASTFTGVSSPETPAPSLNSRHFPAGAAWLIGLGVLFLLGNLLPSWQLDGRWLVPILLGGLAVWIGFRRLTTFRALSPDIYRESAWLATNRVAGALLGPALLATIAILLALQAGDVLPLRHSWPALLIVWGALQLLERAPVGAPASNDAPPAEPTGPTARSQ